MHCKHRGTALVITFAVIMMLTLEVAIISLIAVRGFGQEGLLMSQNISTRRAAEIALNRLQNKLSTYLSTGGTPSGVDSTFTMALSPITNITLTLDNPDGGTSPTSIIIDAWVKERRGNLYHMVGRARQGSTDILLHRWTPIRTCAGGSTPILILSDRGMSTPDPSSPSPDETYPLVVTSSNRVFFGEDTNPGKFWTWNETDGLSTLVSGESKPGFHSLAASSDGRVYFGETDWEGTTFWTWKKDTGLSTLVSNAVWIYPDTTFLSASNRLFFEEWNEYGSWFGWTGHGKIWSWKEGESISTVYTPTTAPTVAPDTFAVSPDGRIYFRKQDTLWTWANGSASTIPGFTDTPYNGTFSNNDALFGSDNRIILSGTTGLWTWNPGGGNATQILVGGGSYPSYTGSIGWLTGVSNDNHYVFTVYNSVSGTSNCQVWSAATGLSTINPSATCYTIQSSPDLTDNKIYLDGYTWLDNNTPAGSMTTFSNPGALYNYFKVAPDGHIYFGGGVGIGTIKTWKNDILSTVISGPGIEDDQVLIAPNGRIFFAQGQNPGSVWTWKEGVGLSTLVSGRNKPGYRSMAIDATGRVYFGEIGAAGNFWTWKEPVCNMD